MQKHDFPKLKTATVLLNNVKFMWHFYSRYSNITNMRTEPVIHLILFKLHTHSVSIFHLLVMVMTYCTYHDWCAPSMNEDANHMTVNALCS